jgi:hypothetical protein
MATHAVLLPTGKVEPTRVSTGSSYAVQIISSINQLQSLATSWNALLLDSGASTLFLSWEWLYARANCFISADRSLFVLAVYHADKLIGLAPFYLQRVRHKLVWLREIHFLGSPDIGSNYLDVICRKGQEKQIAMLDYGVVQSINWCKARLYRHPRTYQAVKAIYLWFAAVFTG